MPLERTATEQPAKGGRSSLSPRASRRKDGIGEEVRRDSVAEELAWRSVGSTEREFCRSLACEEWWGMHCNMYVCIIVYIIYYMYVCMYV